MGACKSKDKQETEQVAAKLKVAIVGVRGHLRAAEEQKSEEQEEKGEEQTEEKGEEQKGRFCVVKAKVFGQDAELYTTKGVEGTCESVWKEEAEFEFDMSGALEFHIMEEGKCLGVGKLEGSAFEEGFNGEVQLEETGDDVEAYIKLKIGVEEKEYPAGLAPEFTVSLVKQKSEALGIDVDTNDGFTLRVILVDEGPFQTYNESAEEKDKVQAGDFIVKANKATGTSSKIMQEMKSAEALELTIKRSEEFSALLTRSDTRKPLGLDFLKDHVGDELVVTKIAKGAVQDWNSSNADRKMGKGDRVVAVCGKKGTAAELQNELNSVEEARLTVVHPASPDSWQFS